MTAYKIIDLAQDSDEWLQWRRTGLGGSDAPTILGHNPWKIPQELIAERIERISQAPNSAMLAGKRDEPIARDSYIERTGMMIAPACLQSTEYPFMLASLDGINFPSSKVVEIKCGKSSYYKSLSLNGAPPDYYMAQLQHILAVTGYDHIDYFSWQPDRTPLLHRVERDDDYIAALIEKEAAFWQRLQVAEAELAS